MTVEPPNLSGNAQAVGGTVRGSKCERPSEWDYPLPPPPPRRARRLEHDGGYRDGVRHDVAAVFDDLDAVWAETVTASMEGRLRHQHRTAGDFARGVVTLGLTALMLLVRLMIGGW